MNKVFIHNKEILVLGEGMEAPSGSFDCRFKTDLSEKDFKESLSLLSSSCILWVLGLGLLYRNYGSGEFNATPDSLVGTDFKVSVISEYGQSHIETWDLYICSNAFLDGDYVLSHGKRKNNLAQVYGDLEYGKLNGCPIDGSVALNLNFIDPSYTDLNIMMPPLLPDGYRLVPENSIIGKRTKVLTPLGWHAAISDCAVLTTNTFAYAEFCGE